MHVGEVGWGIAREGEHYSESKNARQLNFNSCVVIGRFRIRRQLPQLFIQVPEIRSELFFRSPGRGFRKFGRIETGRLAPADGVKLSVDRVVVNVVVVVVDQSVENRRRHLSQRRHVASRRGRVRLRRSFQQSPGWRWTLSV